MQCGNCQFTDGLVYTSNPSVVKCSITGDFHHTYDECNTVTSINNDIYNKKSYISSDDVCNAIQTIADYLKQEIKKSNKL